MSGPLLQLSSLVQPSLVVSTTLVQMSTSFLTVHIANSKATGVQDSLLKTKQYRYFSKPRTTGELRSDFFGLNNCLSAFHRTRAGGHFDSLPIWSETYICLSLTSIVRS